MKPPKKSIAIINNDRKDNSRLNLSRSDISTQENEIRKLQG